MNKCIFITEKFIMKLWILIAMNFCYEFANEAE